MVNKRLLLITYAFSPLQAPEAYLAAKSLSKLQNFDVDVLTLNISSLGLPEDRSLDEFISKNFGVIYRAMPPKWLKKSLFNFLRYFSFFPDRFSFLNHCIVKAAAELDVKRYDVILSWSQWHSIHLAANVIAKKYPSVRWVAHMSDPWADNPFLPKIFLVRWIQRLMERIVIKAADSIHFTTIETRNLVMKNYPKVFLEKVNIFPHVYVSDLYPKRNFVIRPKAYWTIRYLGNFYGPRNPKIFAKVIARIQSFYPEILEGVKIEFIGRWIGFPSWGPKDEGVQGDVITFKSPVNYLDSLKLMRAADLLLIIDAPFEDDKNVFFPSKLVDYIGAETPILAITPPGACAEIVNKVGGIVVPANSCELLEEGLRLAIQKMKLGLINPPNSSIGFQYEATYVAQFYDNLLLKLTQN